mmetsp:Transcript_28217/g.63884  ORF Transcript_28217/g.63884 Transcript_28217/m.63884 type:complete len:204 (+) Transcript_28217:68-679(+)
MDKLKAGWIRHPTATPSTQLRSKPQIWNAVTWTRREGDDSSAALQRAVTSSAPASVAQSPAGGAHAAALGSAASARGSGSGSEAGSGSSSAWVGGGVGGSTAAEGGPEYRAEWPAEVVATGAYDAVVDSRVVALRNGGRRLRGVKEAAASFGDWAACRERASTVVTKWVNVIRSGRSMTASRTTLPGREGKVSCMSSRTSSMP